MKVRPLLLGFVLTLLVALFVHPAVAVFLTAQMGLSPMWAQPVAFLGVWLGAQLVYSLLVKLVLGRDGRNQGCPSSSRRFTCAPNCRALA